MTTVHLEGYGVSGPCMWHRPACGVTDDDEVPMTPDRKYVTCGRCRRVKSTVKVLRSPHDPTRKDDR